jgi:hypothetical protein
MAKQHAKDPVMHKHLEQWQESGLTQTEYCRQTGIKRDNFNYYKQKFSKRKSSVNQNHQLVPVKLLDNIEQVRQTVKISHCNGFSFEINPGDELSHLKPLLSLLSTVQ